MKAQLDLSNYAAKADLKETTGVAGQEKLGAKPMLCDNHAPKVQSRTTT